MQVTLWPIKRLRAKDFAIDMLFEYDEDWSTLMWCQGKVVDFSRESKEDKHVFVKIEWSD